MKIDTDIHEDTVDTFNIQGTNQFTRFVLEPYYHHSSLITHHSPIHLGLPLFGLFVKGKMVASHSGALNKQKLTELIDKGLADASSMT